MSTATTYNARFKLTPMPATNRWRKIYRGKIYYVGIGNCRSKSDRDGYRAAWNEWARLREALDRNPSEAEAARYDELLTDRERISQVPAVVAAKLAEHVGPEKMAEWKTKREKQAGIDAAIIEKYEGKPKRKNTVGGQVEEFIALKQSRCDLGEISASRVRVIGVHLRHFETWIGPDKPLSEVTGDTLVEYRKVLLAEMTAGKLSITTASDRFHQLREWIRGTYAIPLPRNISSRDLSISRQPKAITIFSSDEIKTLLEGTPERFQLWVLLMLNCGMYQGDVSDLMPSEVDWTAGTITRKRSKVRHLAVAPTVAYKLWPRTFELLKKYGNRDGERVLLNAVGKPLVHRDLHVSVDNIYDCYIRLFPEAENRKPLKCLRKTGASTLDNHDVFGRYVEHYLAHSPGSITDQSYRQPAQHQFDRAIKWLGKELGI